MRAGWLWRLAGCLLWALSAPAEAQVASNDYTLDLYQGPATGSGRIVGMGGAYTAIAEGIDGAALNPAGYAERGEHEVGWFDWEATGGFWLSGLFVDNDYDNNGNKGLRSTNVIQAALGLRLQFANVGVGAVGQVRTYKLKDPDTGKRTAAVTLYMLRNGAAYSFEDFVIGGALLLGGLDVDSFSVNVLTSLDGVGGHVGGLYRPKGERYRIGAAFRSSIKQCFAACFGDAPDDPNMPVTRGNLVVPQRVEIPWELRLGFAYQWGERHTNSGWQHTAPLKRRLRREIANGTYEPPATLWGTPYRKLPEDNPRKALRIAMRNHKEFRRRYRHIQPRRYVLLSVDAVLIDKVDNGQGLEAFLTQSREASGEHYSFALHGGIETEVVSDILKLRAGGYLEPSRFEETAYRPHLTMGGDVRLFDFWRWSSFGRFTIDIAPRYINWGFSWGIWR